MDHTQSLTNRVDLALNDYIELYEFRKNLEADKVAIINWTGYPNNNLQSRYVSLTDAFKEIEDINKKLVEINEKLTNDKNKLMLDLSQALKKIPVEDKPSMNLDDVKKMSIWQFLKWRKKKSDVSNTLGQYPNLRYK
jgi:hypothetical protein